MPNINFACPNCNTKGKITLMGETYGNFEKKCTKCAVTLNLDVKDNKLINTAIKENKKIETKIKVPQDYQKYEFKEGNERNKKKTFWVKTISFLILSASIMGLMTGGSLYYAPEQFNDSEEIKIYLIVENKTDYIDTAVISIDNKVINQTFSDNGTYIINLKPGKYRFEVNAESYKTSVMEVYIPPWATKSHRGK